MVEEMIKLREKLDDLKIKWVDKSDKFKLKGGGEFFIDRTHFDYNDKHYSAINGFGTYGGCNVLTGKNEGLLELMIDSNTPEGYLTADKVIEKLKEGLS